MLKNKFNHIKIFILVGLFIFLSVNTSQAQENNSALDRIKERGSIMWGADAEGGAPYIFPDPENPEKYIGFEVDLAEAIASKLGVKAVHKQNAWDGLVPALERGDFDIAMNGIEITDDRKETILFTNPYYIYVEQLVVRKEETKIQNLTDLKGKKVGTLSGTVAQDILQNLGDVDVRIYPGQVQPYEDLAIGRIDAVLLDLPIAAFYGKPNPKLKYAGEPMGEGLYGIAIRKEDAELKAKIDEILAELLKSGELKKIYEKWDLWNEAQNKLYAQMAAESGPVDQKNNALDRIKERGSIIWGADAEGGAPYIFPDPEDPEKYIGFEVDLADAIAQKLGVKAIHKQNAWDGLVPALERGDFDIAMNGIEITDDRKETILFSRPYYIYVEQLVVRKEEENINDLTDLKGKKVGTLSGTVAQDILQDLGDVEVRIYPGQVEPYTDLAIGRIDAVLLDLPIAAFYGKQNPKLKYAGKPMGEGLYGIAIRKEHEELKVKIDEILAELLKSGELKKIYEKWDLWNEAQDKLYEKMQVESGYADLEKSRKAPISTFIPSLLKGAAITIIISVVSMALAVTLGLFITLVRLYGRPPFTYLATAYIEIYRGTPLLIQLYLLYYGLPNIGISLSPWAVAFIGLGMNYAAYEAEIYRAGISAIPKGQMEAALSLGMSRNLAIRRIILPQSLRISLPGITNDFIALFKDSSLVSIIAMVELTKTYNILAASSLRYFELGLITAILYFGMSYPLSLLARRLENRLKGKKGGV